MWKSPEFGDSVNLADLPYIPPAQMMRIRDATFVKAKCPLKKVKSFARLTSKPFAITGSSCRNRAGHQTLPQL
ncbi:MAG: hypothetical protein DMC62_04675 [Verrucomicrobia bacterium]|nr:MAG: hypothetical protein DMC62_04675 [Verrucomicrobiota bacterium]